MFLDATIFHAHGGHQFGRLSMLEAVLFHLHLLLLLGLRSLDRHHLWVEIRAINHERRNIFIFTVERVLVLDKHRC